MVLEPVSLYIANNGSLLHAPYTLEINSGIEVTNDITIPPKNTLEILLFDPIHSRTIDNNFAVINTQKENNKNQKIIHQPLNQSELIQSKNAIFLDKTNYRLFKINYKNNNF